MKTKKQDNSPQKNQTDKSKLGKKPIGLAGGQSGGQINGPTGSSVPDKRANPDENRKK